MTAKHEFAVWETNNINWWIMMTTRPAITDQTIQGRGGWICSNHRPCIITIPYLATIYATVLSMEGWKRRIAIHRERKDGWRSSSIEDFPLYYRPSTGFQSITIIIVVISGKERKNINLHSIIFNNLSSGIPFIYLPQDEFPLVYD